MQMEVVFSESAEICPGLVWSISGLARPSRAILGRMNLDPRQHLAGFDGIWANVGQFWAAAVQTCFASREASGS